jgi:Kinesin motor domain
MPTRESSLTNDDLLLFGSYDEAGMKVSHTSRDTTSTRAGAYRNNAKDTKKTDATKKAENSLVQSTNEVQQWLQEIVLDEADVVGQAFADAGIDTAQALSSLDVSHFPALHIHTSADRRKVFFLIQRIQQLLKEQNEIGEGAKADGALKKKENCRPTAAAKVVATEVHPEGERLVPRQQSVRTSRTTRSSVSSRKLVKSASDILDDVLNDNDSKVDSVLSPPPPSLNPTLPQNSVGAANHRTSGLVQPKATTSILRNGRAPSSLSETTVETNLTSSPAKDGDHDFMKHRRRSHSLDVRPKRQLPRLTEEAASVASPADSVSSRPSISTAAASSRRLSTAPNVYQRSNSVTNRRRQSVAVTNTSNNHGTKKSNRSLVPFPSTSLQQQILQLRQEATTEWELFANTSPPSDDDEEDTMRIRVIVRPRPLTAAERDTHDIDILQPLDYGAYGRLCLYQPRTRVDCTQQIDRLSFCFDNVFAANATNAELYQRAVRNLIPSFLSGQWASIFAYGQTGSGVRVFCGMSSAGSICRLTLKFFRKHLP